MKKLFYLFKVSIEKSIKELIRYKFDTISDIVSFYFLFIAMFYGTKSVGISMKATPSILGETLEGLIVGYFLWTVMVMVYSDTAHSIVSDASTGTLEQVSMSSLGLDSVMIVRSIANLIINLLVCFIVLFAVMLTTGYWLNVDVLPLLVLIILGIFSILGIALIIGGLALIFKRIKSLLNIVQFFLIALVFNSSNSLISLLLPFKPSIWAVYQVILGGNSFMDFSLLDYGIIVLNSAVYFFIGLFVFNQCTKVAKKKGLMGQY